LYNQSPSPHPYQIYCVIGLFDYFRVTTVWIKHWWRDETLAWFRNYFCSPRSTANTLCAAPVTDNVTEWCIAHYNSTECEAIRGAAQSDMERFMISYYYINAIWGLCLIALVRRLKMPQEKDFPIPNIRDSSLHSFIQLLLVVNTLESIISRPLVQKSRESNVPAWFLLPTVGSLSIGTLYAFSNTSVLSTRSGGEQQASWIGPLYIVTGGKLSTRAGSFLFTYSPHTLLLPSLS
jgi:hypothetical protein